MPPSSSLKTEFSANIQPAIDSPAPSEFFTTHYRARSSGITSVSPQKATKTTSNKTAAAGAPGHLSLHRIG